MPISHHFMQQLATERIKDLRIEGARASRRRSLPGISRWARRRPGADQLDDLVRAAAAGDESAWNKLHDGFGSRISAVARLHRLNAADAADVAQTTWLRLYEHIDRISEPESIGAWLAVTARHECLRVLRASDRVVLYGASPPETDSHELGPDESALTQERDEALWRSFARLQERDQVLLGLMVASHEPSYQQISTALDMPIGSIGPTRQRALERLRDQLESEDDLALMSA